MAAAHLHGQDLTLQQTLNYHNTSVLGCFYPTIWCIGTSPGSHSGLNDRERLEVELRAVLLVLGNKQDAIGAMWRTAELFVLTELRERQWRLQLCSVTEGLSSLLCACIIATEVS